MVLMCATCGNEDNRLGMLYGQKLQRCVCILNKLFGYPLCPPETHQWLISMHEFSLYSTRETDGHLHNKTSTCNTMCTHHGIHTSESTCNTHTSVQHAVEPSVVVLRTDEWVFFYLQMVLLCVECSIEDNVLGMCGQKPRGGYCLLSKSVGEILMLLCTRSLKPALHSHTHTHVHSHHLG